jgi:microsomal dipeptidase-like Zn-dependent dipeptidase
MVEHYMKRRNFLKYLTMLGLGPFMSRFLLSCAEPPIKTEAAHPATIPLAIFDAHAHPDQFFSDRPPRVDTSASMESIRAASVLGCSFSAVGDLVAMSRGHVSGSESAATRNQLARAQKLIDAGKLSVVTKPTDVMTGKTTTPQAVLAVEGGDCLQGDVGQLHAFYDLGVRSICLMHYTINEIGDIATENPKHNGLTHFGKRVVEKMQAMGMVVDAAHAHSLTLKDIAAISSRPIMDSHTSPAPVGNPSESTEKAIRRMRSWKEMEWVAKTGGVIGTWPLRYTQAGWQRESFADWAKEILQMKSRLGIEHVGLGTDGGGMLPRMIVSYSDYRDLQKLAAAMEETGLSTEDIHAFMSGNFTRVFNACVA